MNNSLEIAKKSYINTIQMANRLFASESPKHDLYLTTYGKFEYKLMSTSGTLYCTGTRQSCMDRMDDLLLFALTGYEMR